MKARHIIPPGSLNRLLQAADAAWERSNFQECIETLQRAHRLAPSNTSVLLQLVRVQGLRGDYVAAERYFEQALRIAPRKTDMLTAIADQCLNFFKPEIVERYLRRAIEQPDATPLAYIKLAELYERLHRLPEAEHIIQQVLTHNPSYPPGLLIHARLERLDGRLESAEQVLRSFLKIPHPADWTQVHAWYELASVLDRQEKYDEAMLALTKAKAFIRPLAIQQLAELKMVRARIKVMEANVTDKMFQRWRDAGSTLGPTKRLVLLSGHARSGTTLLEQLLDAHPDIVSAEETTTFVDDAFTPLRRNHPPETHMLPVLEAADQLALQHARAAYFHCIERLIGNPIANRLLIDKNPGLNFMIPAFIRIFPETKFLIALRDPRDVVLSCFMQNLPITQIGAAYLSLEGTVEDYTQLMSNWLKLAPLMSGSYLEVRYEEVVKNLESVARKTLEFLDVPWDDGVLDFNAHARGKMVRSPTYSDVIQPVYQRARGRWRNYKKYLEPHLAKLEPFVKAFGYE